VADFDVIFVMDELNFANLHTAFPKSRPKLRLLGGVNASGSYRPHEIPDPYLATNAEVSDTMATIRRYVAALAQAIARGRRDGAPADARQRHAGD